MKTIAVAACVTLLCLVGAAAAQGEAEATLSAREVVAARKAGMSLSGAAMTGMKAAIDSGVSVRGQASAAGALARWGRAMPGLFPAGTGEDDLPEGATDALGAVWTDREDFEARARAFAEAAATLQDHARADDAAAFAEQWGVVRSNCQSCHQAYKAD